MLSQIEATVPTGSGNTRFNCLKNCHTSVSIHWLDCVYEFSSEKHLRDLVDYICGKHAFNDVALWLPAPMIKGERYELSIQTYRNIMIGYNLPDPGSGRLGKARISIPGSALERFSIHELYAVFFTLNLVYKVRVTRLDIALDFYGYHELIKKVEIAGRNGNFAGVGTYHPYKSFAHIKGKYQLTGNTHYFGSRESDKQLRVYDKSLESDGKIDCIRCELQLRREYAHSVFEGFASIDQDSFDELYHQYLAGIVLGSVRFVNRKSGDRLSRQDDLSWYAELQVCVANPLSLSAVRKPSSIHKSMEWINKQVAVTLVTIREALGATQYANWMASTMAKASKRMTSLHHLRVMGWKLDHG
jgi:hypothetical protein